MDPYSEQRLRDEVIYLHSLWHQGPPPPPNPNPNNYHTPSTHPFPPSNPPQFNKPPKRKTPPQSDLEWQSNKPPAAPPTWPPRTPTPPTRILSPEEQAQFAATRVQNKAMAAVEEFFAGNLDSDGEESDEDEGVMGEDGSEEFEFFLKLFTEEEELKGYCEKNWDGRGGEFVCLVCGGMARRKRFKNLVAVVQHSMTVARTKKKNAHRAYAQVVCKVLGWDVDRLPAIDSSSDKPVASQGNAEVAVGESTMINQDFALASARNVETIQKEVIEKQFKKPKRQKKTPPKSDLKWSCNDTPADLTRPGWPSPALAPAPTTRVLTPEEQAQFVVTQVQNKAMAAVEAFFAGNLDSDGEDSGDEDDAVMGEDGYEEYQFFLKLFTEEEEFKELKGYCEKNWDGGGGEFVCLVCGGVGKRKRFKNLVAVVQHSVMVKRTKKKNAHRAYAQVVCRVLGWDIDRLPTIDSSGNAEVAVGESCMINQELPWANVSGGKTVQEEVSDVDQDGEIPSSSISGTSNVGDTVVLRENSVKDGDAGKCLEKLDNGVQSSGHANTGVVTCLEQSEDNAAGNEIRENQKAVVVSSELKENMGKHSD